MNAMPKQSTNPLWTETAEIATDFDNLIVWQAEMQNFYQTFYGDKKNSFASPDNLKTFGGQIAG